LKEPGSGAQGAAGGGLILLSGTGSKGSPTYLTTESLFSLIELSSVSNSNTLSALMVSPFWILNSVLRSVTIPSLKILTVPEYGSGFLLVSLITSFATASLNP